jgi:hypothetical protein
MPLSLNFQLIYPQIIKATSLIGSGFFLRELEASLLIENEILYPTVKPFHYSIGGLNSSNVLDCE